MGLLYPDVPTKEDAIVQHIIDNPEQYRKAIPEVFGFMNHDGLDVMHLAIAQKKFDAIPLLLTLQPFIDFCNVHQDRLSRYLIALVELDAFQFIPHFFDEVSFRFLVEPCYLQAIVRAALKASALETLQYFYEQGLLAAEKHTYVWGEFCVNGCSFINYNDAYVVPIIDLLLKAGHDPRANYIHSEGALPYMPQYGLLTLIERERQAAISRAASNSAQQIIIQTHFESLEKHVFQETRLFREDEFGADAIKERSVALYRDIRHHYGILGGDPRRMIRLGQLMKAVVQELSAIDATSVAQYFEEKHQQFNETLDITRMMTQLHQAPPLSLRLTREMTLDWLGAWTCHSLFNVAGRSETLAEIAGEDLSEVDAQRMVTWLETRMNTGVSQDAEKNVIFSKKTP